MIEQRINESIAVKQALLNDAGMIQTIDKAINAIIHCFKSGNSLYLCGNGGSAADAQHIAAELSGRFYLNRPPLPAESFTVNTSYLTAVSNDFSFDEIFSRLTQAHCHPGDILIGISTSGNSANIIRALSMARDSGVTTIALTGNNGGELKNIADYCIIVPSKDTPRIQEAHILIGHIICEAVESSFFGNLK
ncbi:MAG: phosphoheptose isomerase [Bacteroidetes bacterium GWF2_43_63]|nr:MAG: phosphoheptose isomerase [Bacteroidetes bacterium GWE2_42_42]OFY52689.1 MAG: phosphoheptose isomerase [Bacteroidetes bacterium GWF2_43_63]HBG69309.1 phosphoheptose isomerase [Bacteroidales bacterium]HCB60363.1 phosphoheptose isomerase [Bacteroidales bacterium]HCY23650.1 phosphoheptose isomerase [Bacteroidales bacterium]